MCAHRHTGLQSRSSGAWPWWMKKVLRAELREYFASLLNSEAWLRACALAALRDHRGAATFEPEILPLHLLEHFKGSCPDQVTESPERGRSGQSD